MALSFASGRWRYSRFDGRQSPNLPGPNDLLNELADDLMYHGDVAAALRRLMQEGMTNDSGERLQGLRDLLEQLRRRREELLANKGTNDLADEIARELEEIVSTERQSLENDHLDASQRHDDEKRQKAAEGLAHLDLLPPSPVGQMKELQTHEFSSTEARERFEALQEKVRHDLVQLQLDESAASLASMGDEERAHLRDALDALNQMLEQRAEGQDLDPSFEQFKENFGDVFPTDASDFETFLAELAQRMAAASQLIASMSDAQRSQLQGLSDALLSDFDVAWQLDRLGSNLRDAFPRLDFDQPMGSSSGMPMSLEDAAGIASELAQLGGLEELLNAITEPGQLQEVDMDQVRALLGEDFAEALRALQELTATLERAGLIGREGGRLVLTPEGLRRLGNSALGEMFTGLLKERAGDHSLALPGLGHEREQSTKPYEFGDPFFVHVGETLRNATLRNAADRESPSTPISLSIDDFAIERREHLSSASTVLAIDCSLSMPMRDNFFAAKKVALALQSLTASRFPRDYFGLIAFSATAHEVKARELPELSWDLGYGTNLQHALLLGRKMLRSRPGSRQIIVVTDGEPTAHILRSGNVHFNYPPDRETLEATLAEVLACTRENIVINTFVLDATSPLRRFVAHMMRLNGGRAFFTSPEQLGDFVLQDFVGHRGSPKTKHLRHGQ